MLQRPVNVTKIKQKRVSGCESQKNKAAFQSSVIQHRQESGGKHKGESKEGRRKEKNAYFIQITQRKLEIREVYSLKSMNVLSDSSQSV